MRSFLFPAMVSLFALFSGISSAQADQAVPGKSRLHVMSFNIKGLPSILLSGQYKNERYETFGKYLAANRAQGTGPDLVLLQEAFSENTQALIKAANFPYISQGPPFKTFVGIDSGLYILSRFPILEKAYEAFSQDVCNGWDCFANKGMQYARIQIPGIPKPLDVFNTHLQAGRDDPPARRKQVKMLLTFFRKHHVAGNPVIFGGDFNLRPERDKDTYEDFVKGTGLANSGEYCLLKSCTRSPDTGWQGVWKNAVDHQFFSTNGSVRIIPVSMERTHREPLEGYKLSDHLAHEVIFELQANEAKSTLVTH